MVIESPGIPIQGLRIRDFVMESGPQFHLVENNSTHGMKKHKKKKL